MALANYTDLIAAIPSWLDRSDLTSRIPDFIALFEAKANRRLRVRQQLITTPLTPSSGSVALPADYLEWKRVTWTGSPRRELEYVEPTYLQAAYPTQESSTPRLFSVEGANILIRPIDDANLEFEFYQKIPALSESALTNWLMTAHPDAYLFGSLVEAGGFMSDERISVGWTARMEAAFAEIVRLSEASRGQAQIRAYGATP